MSNQDMLDALVARGKELLIESDTLARRSDADFEDFMKNMKRANEIGDDLTALDRTCELLGLTDEADPKAFMRLIMDAEEFQRYSDFCDVRSNRETASVGILHPVGIGMDELMSLFGLN